MPNAASQASRENQGAVKKAVFEKKPGENPDLNYLLWRQQAWAHPAEDMGRPQCQVTGTGVAWMDGRAAKMSHFSFSGIHHVGMELLVLSTPPLIFPGCCGSSGRDPQILRGLKGQRSCQGPGWTGDRQR